jgi:hypothetical protein
MARDLVACSENVRAIYARTAITPEKWRQSPWGGGGGGFWVVAVSGENVLWYNDIEEGFNVSRFIAHGRIPDDEYWRNQDLLGLALSYLVNEIEGAYPLNIDSYAERVHWVNRASGL